MGPISNISMVTLAFKASNSINAICIDITVVGGDVALVNVYKLTKICLNKNLYNIFLVDTITLHPTTLLTCCIFPHKYVWNEKKRRLIHKVTE